MGVRKKGRRKIRCSDKLYIWYVQLDFDSPNYLLNVIAEDKTLILSCPLHTEKPYIISKGRAFQNRMTDGIWHRYLLPFDVPQAITPRFVSTLIQWSMEGANAVEVDWNVKEVHYES